MPIANDSSESPDPSTDSSAATHTAQSSSDDSASTPVVEHGIKKPARRRGLDVSVPAIVATIALVVFSVFIGVLGPRIGRFLPDGTVVSMPGHNSSLFILGVMILWFGW